MRFEESVEVQIEKAIVWRFLGDVEQVARHMPGCQEVREVVPELEYEAVVEEQLGPFKIRFDMEIAVLERRPEELIRIQAHGTDKKLGTSARGEMEVRLEEKAANATVIDIEANIQITGKVASLGQAAIKRKAQDMVQQFTEELAAHLQMKSEEE